MEELDYKILVRMVQYAEQIEFLMKHKFKNQLSIFRNRPRTPRVTIPKAICLLFTYKLSQLPEMLSEELKSAHQQVDWNKIANLRSTIITREEGFFDPEAAWEVLTVDIPAWDESICKILKEYDPDFGKDVAYKHHSSRFAEKN